MKLNEERQSFLKSFGLHFAIAMVLLLSVAFGHEPIVPMSQPTPVIQATFIDAQAIYDKQQAAIAAEQERQREAERQRKAQEQAKRKAAADKARKERQAKERAEQRELERKAQEAAERKRQEEARKKREAEEKAKKEAERKEQQALERLMQEQLAQEQAAQAKRRSQQVLSEVDKYKALITQTINQYVFSDDSFRGKSCLLNIRMASSGLVTQVTILEGDPALCRASRSAALRPDKLPMSDDIEVYQQLKDFNLRVSL
ncbi:cell envelope integrity protein TolA [Alteromonas facilis]|uniref:cell envelope integrity protein TolA n=1 Tax=Alteromonas facilis TaxID=2048004 RepID=UPI000C288957|nr:cell envelope integrity protein TolA [Alteromonas facilis]